MPSGKPNKKWVRAVIRPADNPARYLPRLALSPYNMGGVFTKLGRADVALDHNLESDGIHRELSSRNPVAHQPDFAMSLNNLASAYVSTKDQRAGLARGAGGGGQLPGPGVVGTAGGRGSRASAISPRCRRTRCDGQVPSNTRPRA